MTLIILNDIFNIIKGGIAMAVEIIPEWMAAVSYTHLKKGPRRGDAAEVVILELV